VNDVAEQVSVVHSTVKRAWSRRALRWTEHVLAMVGVCFIISRLCFEFVVMTSGSMSPTLQGTCYANGDRLLVEKVSGWFRSPRRWQVHFFYNEDGVAVAKRIIGLPGERVALRKNRIYINGTEIERPSWLQSRKYLDAGNLSGGREVECGTGYYVLGDDSHDSYDSRFTGPVAPSELRGRAAFVVWPLSRVAVVR
jgi:signal peptidase I